MKPIKTLTAVLLSGLIAAGCQSNPTTEKSGFMSSYDGFKVREWSDGALVYMKPGSDLKALAKYKKLMIVPPEVWYGKQASYKGINPNELKYVTDGLVSKLKATFEPEYPIVDKPGKDVLLIRSAITGVERKYPDRSALGYIPIALLVEAGKNAASGAQGEEIIVYKASLEAEVFDSVTGELVAAVIDTRESDKQSVPEGQKNIKMVDNVLDYWVARFKRNWDRAHSQ
ncbi:MAG: DUF3313 domain-containing protein [Motiliproteus sp.]|nr:DUF3313 domain-containing protein [Motiliproteus sp.]MCW9052859.1 DUF3313 domain-containing protein [Motiliproteus sp.]